MASGSPSRVTVKPNVDNTVRLKMSGEVFSPEGREVAGRLNAVIAYWNTVLGRNDPPDEPKKLKADTGPIQVSSTTPLTDDPFSGQPKNKKLKRG